MLGAGGSAEQLSSIKRAVTLVHRLQRERGATCAWVAGGEEGGAGRFYPCQCGTGSLVADVRRRTDRSVVDDETRAALAELRELSEKADSTNPASCAKAFSLALTGYSTLIKRISSRAFSSDDRKHSALAQVAKLKESFAQQRGFLVGVGRLPQAALAVLPAHALVFFMQLQEEQRSALEWLRAESARLAPFLRGRLDAALRVDDDEMSNVMPAVSEMSPPQTTPMEEISPRASPLVPTSI